MDNNKTNNAVNPFVALLIILVFGGLFGLKFYFYQQAADIPKISHIKSSSSGNVFIRLGESLYDYSPAGELNRVINLSELNIANHFGDFDFFSNGDILINRDEFLPNFKDRIKTFNRSANTNLSIPEQGKGLQRCDLSTLSCTLFTDQIPMLQGAFALFIDRTTDDVYLADTGRHHIRKLDKEGNILAEITSDLAFPNQVWLDGDSLWIVDTNHHQMKAVQSDTETFGTLIEKHKTTLSGQHTWPSAFAKVDDKWWITISNNAMENGKISVFTSRWKKGKTLPLPSDADPISLLVVNDKVLITDANNYALYQFDFEGKQLQDFAFDDKQSGIQPALQKNKTKSVQLLQWSDYSLWAAIGLFIPIFIFALFQAKKDSSKKKEQAIIAAEESLQEKLPTDGEWLESKNSIKVAQLITLILFIILIISGLGITLLFYDKIDIELLALMMIIPFIFLIMLPIRKLSQLKVGFFENQVTIEIPSGQLISSPYHEVKWHDRAFLVGEWVVPIGNKAHSMHPYERLTELLLPRMLESNKLTNWELQKQQWHSPDGTLKGVTLAVLLGLIMMIILERDTIQSFLSSIGLFS